MEETENSLEDLQSINQSILDVLEDIKDIQNRIYAKLEEIAENTEK